MHASLGPMKRSQKASVCFEPFMTNTSIIFEVKYTNYWVRFSKRGQFAALFYCTLSQVWMNRGKLLHSVTGSLCHKDVTKMKSKQNCFSSSSLIKTKAFPKMAYIFWLIETASSARPIILQVIDCGCFININNLNENICQLFS
jgi:hypothetical protein